MPLIKINGIFINGDNMEYCFYRESLNKNEKVIYDKILSEIKLMKQNISFKSFCKVDVSKIYYSVLLDHPSIYYVGGFKYTFTPLFFQYQLVPEYFMSLNDRKIYDQKLHIIKNELVNKCWKPSKWETILKIHDFLGEEVIYEENRMSSHNILGTLLNKRAVCEGIAKSFKYICDEMGIECILVNGKGRDYNNGVLDHSWNKVKINGEWYNIDATFDMKKSNCPYVKHDFFMLSDKKFSNTHFEDIKFNKVIALKNDLNYYDLKGCNANSKEEAVEIIRSNLVKKENNFEILFSYVNNLNELTNEINNCVCIAIQNLCFSGSFYYSYNEEFMTALLMFKRVE